MQVLAVVSEQLWTLLVLGAVFALLGYLSGRPLRLRRHGMTTDLAFYFVQAIFNRTALALSLAAVVVFAWGGDAEAMRAALDAGGVGVAAWPLWQQTLVVFLGMELLIYWQHRLLHGRHLWSIHAVHHSSADVDWLSTYRMHPIEVMFYAVGTPILLMIGFSLECFVWIGLFRVGHSSLVHADLPWRFGPLRYVVTSPVVHRWHHETASEANGKNFASTFVLYDVLFGTFYCPAGKLPQSFGITDAVPATFVGQLAYPFRRR